MAKVELQSGGSIEVKLDVDLFELTPADRNFVFGLVGKVTGYREKYLQRSIAELMPRSVPTIGYEPEETNDVGGSRPGAMSDAGNHSGAETSASKSEPVSDAHPTPTEASRSVTTDLGEPRARQGEVLKQLQRSGGPLTARDLLAELQLLDPRLDMKAIRNSLSELIRKGLVANPERGAYTAAVAPTDRSDEAEKSAPAEVTSEEEPDGEQPEPSTLQQLVQEIRKTKDPVKPRPLEHVPVSFVTDPPTFREDVEEDRARKQLEELENKYGQVADALPLAHGPTCKWHVGCDESPARVVPSYSGGRLLSTFTTELCRRHVLVRIQSDRITLTKAREFSAEWAERKVG